MMKKFLLVMIAIELMAVFAAIDHYGHEHSDKLERIASELEYLSDRGGDS